METWHSEMPNVFQSERAGGVPWKQKLLDAGGIDLLQDTTDGLKDLANNSKYPFWLIAVPNVLNTDMWTKLSVQSCKMMQDAQKLGQRPNTPLDDNFKYRSINASRYPCTCEYWYPGWIEKKHKVMMYGHPHDGVDGIKPLVNKELHGALESIMIPLSTCLADKFHVPLHCLPTYVVGNLYSHPTAYIGYHSDDGDLFDAANGPTVIVSLNLLRDSIFVIKPRLEDTEVAAIFGFGKTKRDIKMRQSGYELPVLAAEKSVLVMGGWVQKMFNHRTMSHDDIVENVDAALKPTHEEMAARAQDIREQYMTRNRFCGEHTPRAVSQTINCSHSYITLSFVMEHRVRFGLLNVCTNRY